MGKINKGYGILGGFRGTVGSVVGGNWRGIDTMRAVAKPRKGKSTAAQIDQQMKFGIATKFISAKRHLLEIGFKNFAVEMTGTNSALSHTLRHAITGVSPNYSLDYSKILLFRGSLSVPPAPVASSTQAGIVSFSWTNDPAILDADPTDKAILVVYCESSNSTAYTMAGAARSTMAATLAISGFSGKTVQTWIAFISVDGKRISNSVFAGQLNVL